MRILVVDDEKQIRDYLKVSLESESFNVDMAENGTDGSFLARTNDYDLLILDNVLPGKGGLEICKEVRSRGKNVPIIMLSVIGESKIKANMLNNGADDYLTKPFSFEELMARIRAVSRRGAAGAIEQLDTMKAGDLTINVREQSVSVGDNEIYLTRKEFQLLEYLMRNQGKVVTRAMIMEHVWDMNVDPFSNTIETHILNIRKKTEIGGRKFIHTMPGRGYKLALKS